MTSPPPRLRQRVERRSRPLLVRLTATNRFALPVLSAALLLAGLTVPPAAGVPLLLVLALLVGWLSYLSWPVVEPGARVVRLVTLALVLGAAARRLL